MNSLTIKDLLSIVLLLNAICLAGTDPTCPPEDMINPCTCHQEPGVGTFLECRNIYDANDLKNIFAENPMMRFQGVRIISSSMQYLPYEMVDLSKFQELYIENTTLVSLFDHYPKENEIQDLYIINSSIQALNAFSYGYGAITLTVLNNLQSLMISGTPINDISKYNDFKFPKSLKEIALISTETQTIGYGAFANLENLERIYIISNPLNEVPMYAFPRPFNANQIILDNNNISSFPSDILENTPSLKLLSLRDNNIRVIPEDIFQKRTGDQLTVNLDDNPIRCNCMLNWLVEYKGASIQGTCEYPLKGKSLQDLTSEDFGYC